jgi:hypothetical protein
MKTSASLTNNAVSGTIAVQACRPNQLATIVALVTMLVMACSQETLAAGDPVRGEQIYEGCTDCFSLMKIRSRQSIGMSSAARPALSSITTTQRL